MEYAFYFMLKALFVLKIFKYFGHARKGLDKRANKCNFTIYDVTDWITNDCKTHISQCVKKYKQ